MNFTKSILAASILAASTAATAVPVTGGVSFSSIDSTLFTWDNVNDSFSFTANNAQVDSVSGDFAADLAIGDIGSFIDFEYDADFVAGTVWDFGSLSFSLDAISNAVEVGSAAVIVTGMGTITDGIDSITSSWSMTANTAGGTFSWSSSNDVIVPEPATLALLGLGLAGIGAARRKQA